MKRIRPFLLLVLAAFALMGAGGSGAPRLDARGGAGTDEDFRHKLSQMLQRTDQSIKILRAQITESQSAPFLPDLYLQLAELLSQRSNTLYYVQMELQKGAVAKTSDKEFSPVITAQQEAIAVYRTRLKVH
jgi:hypothetical protein